MHVRILLVTGIVLSSSAFVERKDPHDYHMYIGDTVYAITPSAISTTPGGELSSRPFS